MASAREALKHHEVEYLTQELGQEKQAYQTRQIMAIF